MEPGGLSIDDALTADHVALDGLFAGLRAAAERRHPGAAGLLAAFERRLARHMTWEETLLFPALREADPRYPEKKIESLVIDHARIREQIDALAALLRGGAPASGAVQDLGVLLEGHNRDEEKGVYTDADRVIPEPGRRRLLASWA